MTQPDDSSPWDELTPEQRQLLMSLSTADDEGSALERQVAQAQALQHQSLASQHSSPIGAAMGSVADVLNSGRGQLLEQQGLEKQRALVQRLQAGRGTYAGLAMARRPQAQPLSQPPLVDAPQGPMDGEWNAWPGTPKPGGA